MHRREMTPDISQERFRRDCESVLPGLDWRVDLDVMNRLGADRALVAPLGGIRITVTQFDDEFCSYLHLGESLLGSTTSRETVRDAIEGSLSMTSSMTPAACAGANVDVLG